MSHTCHWPGCARGVPPKMFACKAHWFALPDYIRAAIWRTYRAGQESDKQPSGAYLKAATEARRWALAHEATKKAAAEKQAGLF